MTGLLVLIIAKTAGKFGRPQFRQAARTTLNAVAAGVLMLCQGQGVSACETDQYNLPPEPLADIGDEVAEYTEQNILAAIEKINSEILSKRQCLEAGRGNQKGCESEDSIRERLAYLRSDLAVARAVFDRLGYGLIAFARAGTWMDKHKFRAQPARYKTSYGDSIYVYLPTDYFTISPTVNLYGVNLGTDKIAHFFQQGYTYYRISGRAARKGTPAAKAVRKAIDWGRMSEHTYYGTLVGGVFSNADLAANYAGMKFYEGLTKPVLINERERPAAVSLKDGIWVLNEEHNIRESLLKPFISDHLNEALNPSIFIPGLRSSIRSIVKRKSCPQWKAAFPNETKEDFDARTKSLSRWNGEDYGFRDSKKFITIAGTCFGPDTAFNAI